MSDIRQEFLLNPEIVFLNHGSFGACPKPVMKDYQYWQLALEKEPVQFITKVGLKQLAISKEALAQHINCSMDDFVYVQNPTTAMNIVIKNLNLTKDDEILSTNQEYGAIERTWEYYCKKVGAKFVKAQIQLPLLSKELFLEQFWSAYTPKTKIIFLSQITSATALIFPVKEIVNKAKSLGLMTIIDGAHVPGHISLDLEELDADIYTGACHKWLLTPKGNSFLFVKKSFQHLMDPLVISWGYNSDFPSHSQFLDYHEYSGTKDIAAFLTTPKALEWLKKNNWQERIKVCREELKYYYPIVAKELNSEVLCPITEDFLGQICSIPINTMEPQVLNHLLYEKYQIEIPVVLTKSQTYLRISFQAYNSAKEIEMLIDALREIKAQTNLLA